MSMQIRDREEYERGAKWFADWHREHEYEAAMIDVDGLGYCRSCSRPHYIVEATRGRDRKPATVCQTVADSLGVPCLVVYQDSERHPGQILIDWRNGPGILGWMPADPDGWDVFREIRAQHVCEVRHGA